jgi:hypothetical protein
MKRPPLPSPLPNSRHARIRVVVMAGSFHRNRRKYYLRKAYRHAELTGSWEADRGANLVCATPHKSDGRDLSP